MARQYNPELAINLGLPPSPEFGPRIIPIQFVLTANVPITDDLSLEDMDYSLTNVQSVWIDNNNASVFTLSFPQTLQTIRLKANLQGFFPVMAAKGVQYTVTSVGGGTVTVGFLNVPVPYVNWPTA